MLTSVTSRSGRCVVSGNKVTAVFKAAARSTHSVIMRPRSLLRRRPSLLGRHSAAKAVGARTLLFTNVRRAASLTASPSHAPGIGLTILRNSRKGLRRAMAFYDRMLAKHLFLTCTLTAMILNTLGTSWHQKRSGHVNIDEIYRMCSWAGLVTPIVLIYQRACGRLCAHAGLVGAARTLAMIGFASCWHIPSAFAFFTFMTMLEGGSLEDAKRRVWGTNYWDGAAFALHKVALPAWGVIDIFTFTMVPLQYRALWYNFLGIFYTMAVCSLNAQQN